ncbi:hypothetical protein DEU38_103444 [Rhodococcus sp. AG1013]|uniref:hypothetical protein n=1 Tax=Rhodococcus sp. AG1013 TaxID=2183996 RepID=UPI000E0C8EE8|nr:hypothetical protein [Rhodococcus sp. AG1013]RDI32707.1 hypothetical protein DEU38_103444 [Rhodococcus sp. AG1013]
MLMLERVTLSESDIAVHRGVRRIRANAVRTPADFYSRLRGLRWLDIRGGTGTNADAVHGCDQLVYLHMSSVRGITEMDALPECEGLRLLSLYAQSRVGRLPSFANMTNLRRVELGMMKNLSSLAPVLEAPNLEELLIVKDVPVSDEDVDRILAHPTLRAFDWIHLDVPARRFRPVIERTHGTLDRTRSVHPQDWFEKNAADLLD